MAEFHRIADERIDKFIISVDRSFRRVDKAMSELGLSSGAEAEFSFKLAIKRQKLICGGIQFDTILRNVKKTREYDLILINGSYVALIEVKRKANFKRCE